ncbi:hypothetical protein [Methylobacterium frigidaeris]|uniref:hypothetical protein n=1 Tax=Methylobacterium frigidaeris TaxID=2038277 RepID=UPI001EDF3CBE|nr:hypothetical protein [Methylobacterium frigidaeris]
MASIGDAVTPVTSMCEQQWIDAVDALKLKHSTECKLHTITPSKTDLATAWEAFVAARRATVAVTLSYNPERPGGTASPSYQFSQDGECFAGPTSSLPGSRSINCLPIMAQISLTRVAQDVDWLHRKVDRKLFGTRYNKLPANDRSSFVGFVEKPRSNMHVHLAWTVPDDRVDAFTEFVTDAWLAKSRFASIRVKLIYDGNWGQYISKDQWRAALQDDAAHFVASRTARS